MSIIKYQKITANGTTYQIALPDTQEQDAPHCTELATIDGVTYLHIPDEVTLPTQPAQITVETVDLDDTLRSQIKQASPHIDLINRRVVEAIRERYSIEDEIKLIRLAPSDESTAYNAYVESCRDVGREQKAAIGLY